MTGDFKIPVLLIILFTVGARCDDVFVEVNSDVSVTPNADGSIYLVEMNENNHDFEAGEQVKMALFKIVQGNIAPIIEFVSSSFSYVVEQNEGEETYTFYATQSFDYETQPHLYLFNVQLNLDGFIPVANLSIINIDDEQPSLTPPQCSINENTIYTKDTSTCNCTVSDPDGWLNQMTFKIEDLINDPSTYFDFAYREEPADDVYEAMVFITVSPELNYQNITFYLFDVRAEDGAHHPTTPTDLVRGVVNVIDLPDTDPEWIDFFRTQQFYEQSEQTFTVTAIDGDHGLNWDILYSVVEEQEPESNYISIDDNGMITVQPIDRDKNDISTYIFSVIAYKADMPESVSETLTITFFVLDIDNNPPLVRWILDASDTNVTFPVDSVDPKSTQMSFLENTDGTLNLTISIRDIDTGENAQFTVELLDLDDSVVSYTDAFMIVPTAGYRNGEFFITVRNVTYLDYEKPDWINIQFYVLMKGTLDPLKQDSLLVEIELIDYNDEPPIFPEVEYEVSINETAKKDEFITQVIAEDLDAEDAILEHTLIGSTYVQRVLRIDSASGDIYVNVDNAFDYDTVNPIFVQVRATDKVGHTATVPLTITLLDVNNKAPTISVGDPINVDENQPIGRPLNSTITASDMDTTADLSAEIDWDASYVMKNSRVLDWTNNTIREQAMFLTAAYARVDPAEDATDRDITIDLIVNDNNPNNTTPDFELFDSLFLSLKVTDWMTDPEFIDKQNTSVLIQIGINDINDNAPFFPEADLPEDERDNRTVQEKSAQSTSASSITAIDLDVGDTVTYNCTAEDPNFDWLDVNYNTGAFTVKESNQIDADTHTTFYFNYTCTASDNGNTHTSEPLRVRFYIIDTNDQLPVITIDNIVYVDEKSDQYTKVSDIGTHDDDRDPPFHDVLCSLDRTETCNDEFIIVDNVILVRNNKTLDRDEGTPSYTCPITCRDNPDLLQNDRRQNNATYTVTIILNDINDHTPEVLTKEVVTSENAKEGDTLGIIIAKDIDEGDNAHIDFKVTSVVNEDGEDITDLFDIEVDDDDYTVNATHKQANLIALHDLQGWFGTYDVTIFAADRGDPPLSNNTVISVQVEKFNFEPPRFVYPSENDKNILLLSSQTPLSPLILFRATDSEYLTDFYASDNSESDTCNKWDVQISFEQTSPDTDTFFLISNTERCTGQLQVTSRFNSDTVLGQTYNLNLIATAREGDTQTGEASLTVETSLTINFIDNDLKPMFNCTEMTFEFREEKLDQRQPLTCEASYDVVDDLPVFYYIDETTADDVILDTFEVDSHTGLITLKNVISYKENTYLEFRIVASNDSTATSDNPLSYLTVKCNVIEINNNVPQWRRENFFGAIMAGYARDSTVLTLEATDADVIDQDKLTYVINGTVNIAGTGLSNIQNPFTLNAQSGELRLNFQVDSIMTGYFQFYVTVSDVQDQFGNGPFQNTTSVTIFIITSDNTVDFRFLNTVEEVQNQEDRMLEVISDILNYDAYKQDINKATEDGVDLDDRTIASLYFINGTTIAALPSSTILRAVSSISTYSNLVVELRNQTGLVLMSFPNTGSSSENLEEVLKAWLVGVSVVLGALCLILLVTFVLKTRELNNRIKNLTTTKFGSQESGLNRLGISAPTTNKHTMEGSNPIYNNNSEEVKRDLSKFDDFDGHSIRSGDSDLVGIEDNPEFDYRPSAPRNETQFI